MGDSDSNFDSNSDEPSKSKRPSKSEELHKFLSERPSDSRAALLMQHTPDPDSLGTALAFQWLLETQYGIIGDIFAAGDVSHPQNRTALNVLDIRLLGREAYEEGVYGTVLCLDTVPQNTGFEDLVDEVNIIVDHHQFEVDADFVDIRTCGACCSILWEYLTDLDMDFDNERGIQVATALLFGIRNDTGGLLSENTGSLDIAAHAGLMEKVDRKKLQEIIQYSFPSYLYDLRSIAVENKVVKDSVLISSLGSITQKKRDALPLIADEFIRMEGVETVVIHSIVDEYVEASVRSRNSSLNVHDFCQRIFGKDHAGGKHGAGGARVPMGFLYSPSDDVELRNEIAIAAQKIITQRILGYLSG